MKITRSPRDKAISAADSRCCRLSPTMVLKMTSTPSWFSFSVRYSELVSWRKGVSSSDPMATISAFTEKV